MRENCEQEEVDRMEKHKLHNLISFPPPPPRPPTSFERERKELSNYGDMAWQGERFQSNDTQQMYTSCVEHSERC